MGYYIASLFPCGDPFWAGTNVIELEEHFAAAFDVGDDTNLRLFYMGRELKDSISLHRPFSSYDAYIIGNMQ